MTTCHRFAYCRATKRRVCASPEATSAQGSERRRRSSVAGVEVAREVAGIPLTDRERNALTRIRPGALAAFQRYLSAKRFGDWREQASDSSAPWASNT